MKICKVRPDRSTCSACVATQEMFNAIDDCSRCKANADTYELLQIGTGFGRRLCHGSKRWNYHQGIIKSSL